MEAIGVREARQNLSVYLERVKAGESFTVTEHGRPVALLAPLPVDGDPLAGLVASGRLSQVPRPFVPPAVSPAADGGPSLSDALQEMRDEERY